MSEKLNNYEKIEKNVRKYAKESFEILRKINELLDYYWIWEKQREISFKYSVENENESIKTFRIRLITNKADDDYITYREIESLNELAKKMSMRIQEIGVDEGYLYIQFIMEGN